MQTPHRKAHGGFEPRFFCESTVLTTTLCCPIYYTSTLIPRSQTVCMISNMLEHRLWFIAKRQKNNLTSKVPNTETDVSNFLLHIPLIAFLYCILFLEKTNSCPKEALLAMISVFGPGMINRDRAQKKNNLNSRTGRNRWSSTNTGRTVFEISSVSLLCVSWCVYPSGPCLKVIKTLLCSSTHKYTVFLNTQACVSMDPGLSHFCTTETGPLGGRQDQLLIRKLHAVETAGPGMEEGSAVIWRRPGRASRVEKLTEKQEAQPGHSTSLIEKYSMLGLNTGAQRETRRERSGRVSYCYMRGCSAMLEDGWKKAEAVFAFITAMVSSTKAFNAFQCWISTSGCQILPFGCCLTVLWGQHVISRVLTSGSSASPRLSGAVNLFIVGLRRTCWIIQWGRPDRLHCSCAAASVISATSLLNIRPIRVNTAYEDILYNGESLCKSGTCASKFNGELYITSGL